VSDDAAHEQPAADQIAPGLARTMRQMSATRWVCRQTVYDGRGMRWVCGKCRVLSRSQSIRGRPAICRAECSYAGGRRGAACST
jgi:hypothetical protein